MARRETFTHTLAGQRKAAEVKATLDAIPEGVTFDAAYVKLEGGPTRYFENVTCTGYAGDEGTNKHCAIVLLPDGQYRRMTLASVQSITVNQ